VSIIDSIQNGNFIFTGLLLPSQNEFRDFSRQVSKYRKPTKTLPKTLTVTAIRITNVQLFTDSSQTFCRLPDHFWISWLTQVPKKWQACLTVPLQQRFSEALAKNTCTQLTMSTCEQQIWTAVWLSQSYTNSDGSSSHSCCQNVENQLTSKSRRNNHTTSVFNCRPQKATNVKMSMLYKS